MNLLVISQDIEIRKLVSASLALSKINVSLADSAEEAWPQISEETGPLIVLIDWEIPNNDALDLCRKIREAHFRHYIYVMLITAKKDESNMLAALESGIDDYIQKPFSPDQLIARIKIAQRIVAHERKLSDIISEFRAMSDGCPFPTVSLDDEGCISSMNLVFSYLAGSRSPAELKGREIGELLSLPADQLQTIMSHIQQKKPMICLPVNPTWSKPVASSITIYGRSVKSGHKSTYIVTFVNDLQKIKAVPTSSTAASAAVIRKAA